MKKLKALIIFIFLFGVFCSLFSVFMLFSLECNLKLWEELREAGMKGAQEIDLTRLRAGIISQAIWYAIIGVLSIVSSVGLFRTKEWARKLWLGVLILLAGVNLYWFASSYLQGASSRRRRGWLSDHWSGYCCHVALFH